MCRVVRQASMSTTRHQAAVCLYLCKCLWAGIQLHSEVQGEKEGTGDIFLDCSRVMGGGVPEPCGVSHEGLQSAKCLDCLEE
jgi:hypothetical protein